MNVRVFVRAVRTFVNYSIVFFHMSGKVTLVLEMLLAVRISTTVGSQGSMAIRCAFKLLLKANSSSQSVHLNRSSLCEYWCLARDDGLLNALEHSSQYNILCFS